MESPTVLESIASRLSDIAGQPFRAYSSFDFGREHDDTARSVIVAKEAAVEVLKTVRAELKPGVVAFIGTTNWLGKEKPDGVEIVVANGQSQFDILRTARSDAANYGLDTEDLIQKLKEYDDAFGIDIFYAETDTIQFRLSEMPDPLRPFCEDLYKFCPAIV